MVAKIITTLDKTRSKNGFDDVPKLDTLGTTGENATNQQLTSKLFLQKKARRKGLTMALAGQLARVKNSPLNKSYVNSLFCSEVMLQDGNKLSSKHCKSRWCLVCNSIRTAKLIFGYKDILENMANPMFITLTLKSVKDEDLRKTIDKMQAVFRNIQHNVLRKKYKIRLDGIRKIECNYHENKETFNPHFHLVADAKPCEAILIKSLWLDSFDLETATPEAQDISNIDESKEEPIVELFKYFTKMITKGKFNPIASDVIFTAIRGKRVVQPFGKIRKLKVSEDIEELQSQDADFLEQKSEIWCYVQEVYDWVSSDGELLSEFKPSQKFLKLIDKINAREKKTYQRSQSYHSYG